MRIKSLLKKTLLLSIVVPGLLFAKQTQPRYSHVIFFGDSLSDIGNMPESPNLLEPAYHKLALNLFVPISNPIYNTSIKQYTVIGSNHTHHYPAHAPQPQPPLRHQTQSSARNTYSLNWTQYFTEDAKEAKLLNSATVWPWFWWKTHDHLPTNASINYAWSGAVTDNNCRDFMYQNPNNQCTAASILAGQQAYRQKGFNPTNKSSVANVQVPGLMRQVDLFLQDSANNPKLADDKTLYVILIGGNDLNLSLLDLTNHHFISAFHRALSGASNNVRQAINTLIKQRHAKHIVLFNLFDTSQIPYLQTGIWQSHIMPIKYRPEFLAFSRRMTDSYNRQLLIIARLIKRRYGAKIDMHLFDLYTTLYQAQTLPTFANPQTLYHTCLSRSTKLPLNYYTQLNTCQHGNVRFLFWNDAHPSSYLHQIIADRLTIQLSNYAKHQSV